MGRIKHRKAKATPNTTRNIIKAARSQKDKAGAKPPAGGSKGRK